MKFCADNVFGSGHALQGQVEELFQIPSELDGATFDDFARTSSGKSLALVLFLERLELHVLSAF